jgi:hypothetical protein
MAASVGAIMRSTVLDVTVLTVTVLTVTVLTVPQWGMRDCWRSGWPPPRGLCGGCSR